MKAIAAVLFLALLACADARTILKKSVAKASSVAIAGDDSYSSADAHAKASDGSLAVSNAKAIALEESIAKAKADANADDGSTATADALALATDWSFADADAEANADYWSDANADAVAIAENDGSAKSTADAIAVYEAEADAKSKALADGGEAKATSKAVANNAHATSVAKAESEETHHYYYPDCYDGGCKDGEGAGYHLPSYYYGYKHPAGADIEKHLYPYYYDPFYYKYAHYTNTYSHYHPAIEGGAEAAVKYHGYYVPHPKVEDAAVEVTTVKYYDPALIEYYSHRVYDFGCYEGKFYRCTYDDSCGKCPYGHFCGSVKKNVCKNVSEWVECEEEDVPVCLPYDIPTYKTLFKACGPSYCHPGYKCEAFEHKTCAPKVIVKVDPAVEIKAVHHKYINLYTHDDGKDCDDDCHGYVIPHYEHDDDGCDDDDCHGYVIPHYEHDDDGCDDDDCHDYIVPYLRQKSSAKATATAVSTSHASGEESYTNVDLSASGGGSAYGSADASTENTSASSEGKANEDVGAKIWTSSKAYDGGKAVATGEATYEEDD